MKFLATPAGSPSSAVWPGGHRDVSQLAICLVFLLFLQVFCSNAQHQLPISPESTSDPRCLQDCSKDKQKPICGSDDRTYASRCELKRVKTCLGRKVKTKHKGPCVADLEVQTTTLPSQTLSKCESEKASAEEQIQTSSSTSAVYVAQCNEDGSYSSVQCHASFGWCWCVNDEGRPLPGTAVHHERPTCTEPVIVYPPDDPVFPTPAKPVKGGCDQAARAEFNDNLRRTFRRDYERSLSPIETMELNTNADSVIERTAVERKFSELDINGDMFLQKKELATTRRLMKKVIRPKACVKGFTEHCDLDYDEMISASEWLFCLGGVDDSELETTADSTDSMEVNLPALVTRQVSQDEPSAAILPCHIEYQRATEEANRDSGIFIPECDEDGSYRPVQCHDRAEYCWCAYVDTGRPIPGSSSKKPFNAECDPSATFSTPTVTREFRDCPDANKERFLTKLIAAIFELKNEADSHVTSARTVDEPTGESVQMIRTILWEFHEMDASRNGILEPPEVDNFKDFVHTIRASKKCRKNFIAYCDHNDDDLISQREWLQCFEVAGVDRLI